MTSKTEDFWLWAEEELKNRGLSWYAVERQAGLSNAAISRRARELLPPTYETCIAISQVFNLPDTSVLSKAGLLSPEPEQTADLKEALHLLNQLSPEQRRYVLTTIRALATGTPVPASRSSS